MVVVKASQVEVSVKETSLLLKSPFLLVRLQLIDSYVLRSSQSFNNQLHRNLHQLIFHSLLIPQLMPCFLVVANNALLAPKKNHFNLENLIILLAPSAPHFKLVIKKKYFRVI